MMKGHTWIILLITAVALILFTTAKVAKDKLSGVGDDINDWINETPVGWILGTRSTAAKNAANGLLKLNWLNYGFYIAAEKKYYSPPYNYVLDAMGTEDANRVAGIVINSNSTIPVIGGLLDESRNAAMALMEIKNQVQAGEVTRAYYAAVGKHLGKGINWLSDNDIIMVYNHLKSLPTGVTDKSTGKELKVLSV